MQGVITHRPYWARYKAQEQQSPKEAVAEKEPLPVSSSPTRPARPAKAETTKPQVNAQCQVDEDGFVVAINGRRIF